MEVAAELEGEIGELGSMICYVGFSKQPMTSSKFKELKRVPSPSNTWAISISCAWGEPSW